MYVNLKQVKQIRRVVGGKKKRVKGIGRLVDSQKGKKYEKAGRW